MGKDKIDDFFFMCVLYGGDTGWVMSGINVFKHSSEQVKKPVSKNNWQEEFL
jgi:hypothetical protein